MKTLFLFILPSLFLSTSFCKAQNPTLWGMTYLGGPNNFGTIFSYDISTGTEIARHKFGLPHGIEPFGSLNQANNGLLYGTTNTSGVNFAGEIFSYDISTGIQANLHAFSVDTDGYSPLGALIQASNGLLYGMTPLGPDSIFGRGIIFSYDISTGKYTDLHIFRGADGDTPYGSLIQASDGLLYGMTYSVGTIFSFDISNDSEIVLHDFGNGTGGKAPYGSLMQASDSLLYGLTQYGGKYNEGIIFSYDITTDIEKDIHDFGNDTDGKLPMGSLIQASNGLLYGMTSFGGANDSGTIFSYNISAHKETVLHDFAGDTDGASPQGSLTQASSGSLYGITFYGGILHAGTIFGYDISSGKETVLHDFGGTTGATDGKFPVGDLIEVDSFPITGINQPSYVAYIIQLYPNPASSIMSLNLKLAQEQVINLSLFNILGQQVWTEDLGKTKEIEATIPVINFTNGVYILKVSSSGESIQKEIIVAK